jgi:hypothetical protein
MKHKKRPLQQRDSKQFQNKEEEKYGLKKG